MIWRRKLLDFVTAVESEGALVSMLLMETILDASLSLFGTTYCRRIAKGQGLALANGVQWEHRLLNRL